MTQREVEAKLKRLRLEIERGTQTSQKAQEKTPPEKKPSEKRKNGKCSIKKLSGGLNIIIILCVLLNIAVIIWVKLNPVYDKVQGKNTEERIEIITKYIVENMVYNYIPGIEYNSGKDSLERGGAVCDGYTRAFQRLAALNFIQADIVCGIAGDQSGSGYHAWNKVKLNGKWYWHDVTWIDSGNGKMNMQYYMSGKLWSNHALDKKLTQIYKKRVREIDKLIDF